MVNLAAPCPSPPSIRHWTQQWGRTQNPFATAIPAAFWDFSDFRALSDALIDGQVGVTRIRKESTGAVNLQLGLNEGLATITRDEFPLRRFL